MRSRARARVSPPPRRRRARCFSWRRRVSRPRARRGRRLVSSRWARRRRAETRAFCEGTVMDAVRADAKLVAFLTDARDSAASSSADADVSLADAHRRDRRVRRAQFPELLALGCCLTAEEAAPRTSSPEPPTTISTPPDLPPTRPPPPRRFSSWPRPTPTRRDYPPRGLAANAFACQPPRAASRCGRELVQLYRRAGTEGFDIGTVRAGEILLRALRRRSRGPLRRRRGPKSSRSGTRHARAATTTTTTTRRPPRATPWTPPTRRMLFKSLLAGDLDRRAAARLRLRRWKRCAWRRGPTRRTSPRTRWFASSGDG